MEQKNITMKNRRWVNENIGAIIAVILVGCTLLLFRMILLREVKATEPVQISIVECLKGILFMVAGYYFGSSQGSKNKQDTKEQSMIKSEENKKNVAEN